MYYGTEDKIEYGFSDDNSKMASYVEITEKELLELMEGQCNGKQITPDENGKPILIDRTETTEQKIAEIKMKLDELDKQELRPVAAVINGTSTDYDKAKIAEIESQKTILRSELNKCSITK